MSASEEQPLVPPIRVDFSDADRTWIAERISEVLASGRLTLGQYGEAFETRFAALTGAKHAIAVSSGTSALEIVLRSLGVQGKDVLVPTNTFIATATAVLAAGGNPILMDSDPRTMSTNADEITKRLTDNTAGVIIVHIAGIITDAMPDIIETAARRGLWVLEDAAHAHGSTLNGQHAGTFGIAGTFSFYPTKVMTSAEGGMITTNDDRVAEEARIYRDQGKASFEQNAHIRLGSNWRLSEPHAVIGLRHLENLDQLVENRRKCAEIYDDAFASGRLGLTPIAPPTECRSNYYKYPLMLQQGADRAKLKHWLRSEHGIICAGEAYESPLHRQPVLEYLNSQDLGQSETLCAGHICLPMFASMTREESQRVIDAVKAAGESGLLG